MVLYDFVLDVHEEDGGVFTVRHGPDPKEVYAALLTDPLTTTGGLAVTKRATRHPSPRSLRSRLAGLASMIVGAKGAGGKRNLGFGAPLLSVPGAKTQGAQGVLLSQMLCIFEFVWVKDNACIRNLSSVHFRFFRAKCSKL